MSTLTLQRKLLQDAQTAFILTHGAAAFWFWSRYWAWVERNLEWAEEMMGGERWTNSKANSNN